MAEVWCRQFRGVSYHWYYHVRSWKRQLCSVVPPTMWAQAISSIFSLKNPTRAKLAAINNKNGCGTAEVWWRQFGRVLYHWYYQIRSGKRGVVFFLVGLSTPFTIWLIVVFLCVFYFLLRSLFNCQIYHHPFGHACMCFNFCEGFFLKSLPRLIQHPQ